MIAQQHALVADGRDTGSIVFPDADSKFFLTASVAVRAKRWQQTQEKKGNHFSVEQAIAIITERDERDSTRAIAPLVIPEGAIVIDNSDLDIKQTLQKILMYINKEEE